MFNAMALIHYEEMIERGVLPAELNDMPNYGPISQGRRKARRTEVPQAKAKRKAPDPARSGPAIARGRSQTDRANRTCKRTPDCSISMAICSVSVDLETTGRRPGHHEIIQIACVPLGPDFKPAQGLMPFYTEIKPNYPERAEKQAQFRHNIPMEQLLLHAPDQDKVKDLFVEWFERLDLPFKKSLVPTGAQLGL